jgi:hypothetical protein
MDTNTGNVLTSTLHPINGCTFDGEPTSVFTTKFIQPVQRRIKGGSSINLIKNKTILDYTTIKNQSITILNSLQNQILEGRKLIISDNKNIFLKTVINMIDKETVFIVSKLNFKIDLHAQLSMEKQILNKFKPIITTGDGSCFYNAVSLLLFGTESYSDILRLAVLYALIKYKNAFDEIILKSGSYETFENLCDKVIRRS